MRADVYDADELLGYFAWGLEEAPVTTPIATYLTTREPEIYAAVQAIRQGVTQSLSFPHAASATDATAHQHSIEVDISPSGLAPNQLAYTYSRLVFRDPFAPGELETQYGSDERPENPPVLSEVAYRLTLTGFVGVCAGSKEASQWLGLLMLRGGLNRQLAIARFFDLTIDSPVSFPRDTPPERSAILTLARNVIDKPQAPDQLYNLVYQYVERSRRH
jgi:hypothetical protein